MEKNRNSKKYQVLEFINEFSSRNGYMPSVREICKAFDMTSSSSAFYYLTQLENEGLIVKSNGKNRAITITGEKINKKANIFSVVGKVAAGKPIFAAENLEEEIDLPTELFGINNGDMFMLNVSGDSMVKAGIFSGDKIVVRKQETAENGEIVVAMVDDSATVKRFYKENNHFRLQPENDFMSPIIADNCQIIGIVVGLIRQKIN